MGFRAREHLKLAVLLLGIATICAVGVMSCGDGGGGGSDGLLCSQCGDTDGPCVHGTVSIPSGERTPSFCAPDSCNVFLVCARKLDSSQRRCFPSKHEGVLGEVDLPFECDGARPNPKTATPIPMTITPTPGTATATPTTPTPFST